MQKKYKYSRNFARATTKGKLGQLIVDFFELFGSFTIALLSSFVYPNIMYDTDNSEPVRGNSLAVALCVTSSDVTIGECEGDAK